jgi:hypothetical protein
VRKRKLVRSPIMGWKIETPALSARLYTKEKLIIDPAKPEISKPT